MDGLYFHLVPGRFRLQVPDLKGNYQLGESLEKHLTSLPGISQATAKPSTGRVLIFFKETEIKYTDIIISIDTVIKKNSTNDNGQYKTKKASAKGYPNLWEKQLYHCILSFAIGTLLIKHYFWGKSAISRSQGVQTISAITTILISYPIFSRGFKKLAKTKRVNYELIASASILIFLLIRENYLGLGVAWLVSLTDLTKLLNDRNSQQIISEKLAVFPSYVKKLHEGHVHSVSAKELRTDDVVTVNKGDLIPVDGRVLTGSAVIDISRTCGIPYPVTISLEDQVLAGSLMIDGSVSILTQRVHNETMVGGIINEAANCNGKNLLKEQLYPQANGKILSLSVLLASMVCFFTGNIQRSLIILVAAVPAALNIGTHSAYSAAVAKARNKGIYIKNDSVLKLLAESDVILFDKTGTLTDAQVIIEAVFSLDDNFTREQLLNYAALAESGINHPVAHSIREKAYAVKSDPAARAKNIDYKPGLGVSARIGEEKIVMGNSRYMGQEGIHLKAAFDKEQRLAGLGLVPLYIAVDGKLRGILGVKDIIKKGSKEAVYDLRASGMENLVVFSGDKTNSTVYLAEELGLIYSCGELLPREKAKLVTAIRGKKYKVAVVGDGINDLPAMRVSDVSIAMGCSCMPSAACGGDIVIFSDDPRMVSYLYHLTKKTNEVERQNNCMIAGFGVAGIFLGTAGFLNLITAGIITNIAVLAVLVNAYGLPFIKQRRPVDFDPHEQQAAATTLAGEVLCEYIDWHKADEVSILEILYSDPGYGLDWTNRLYRLQEYGANELTVHGQTSLIKLFFEPFKDFMVRLLLAAGVASFLVGEVTDAVIIGGIVLLEAILGVVQGYRSEKALQALKELSAPTAKAIIDGMQRVIPARELVLGDIILLEAGDQVPADARLLQAENLEVEEASLTGESLPVQKNAQVCLSLESNPSFYATNMIYMGTSVMHGSAKAVVVATGMQTKMGQMARMLQETKEEMTPLQIQMNDLGKKVSYICLAACGCVVVVGLLRGQPTLQMVRLGISMAVGAIPEGLPAVVTIALAFGVHRMVKKNTVIRKLLAVETLGSSTIICTDKTGTITQNVMTVTAVYCNDIFWLLEGDQYYPVDATTGRRRQINPKDNSAILQILLISALCNNAKMEYAENRDLANIWGDPTERALLSAVFKARIPYTSIMERYCREKEIPFTSDRKMMSVLCKDIKGEKTLFTKGAPDKILNICSRVNEGNRIVPLDQKSRERIFNRVNHMASQALRVLALAYKPITEDESTDNEDWENNLVFAGLVGLEDPPKEGVKDAVLKCHTAGLKVMMITGDHPLTAVAIAEKVGLLTTGKVLTGYQLENFSDEELEEIIDQVEVCARTTPEHKLRIVKALKKKGHIVAMTGDGVNDAPAVKEANVGIAMGISGMEVTKEASSMVLTDDNFSSIVSAVEEGRAVSNNISNTIKYVLSGNLGEVIAIFASALGGVPLPLVPSQILFINVVTESIPAMALGAQPPERDILGQSHNNSSVISGSLKNRIIIRGLLTGFFTYGSYLRVFKISGNLDRARTIAFSNLVISQLFNYFKCNKNISNNSYLLPTAGISAALLLAAIYIPFIRPFFLTYPLNLKDWAIILTASLLTNKIEDMSCGYSDQTPSPSFQLLCENNTPIN